MSTKNSSKKSILEIWKSNKKYSSCVVYGIISSVLFYVIFGEILWMGLLCLWIGIVGLYRKVKF